MPVELLSHTIQLELEPLDRVASICTCIASLQSLDKTVIGMRESSPGASPLHVTSGMGHLTTETGCMQAQDVSENGQTTQGHVNNGKAY